MTGDNRSGIKNITEAEATEMMKGKSPGEFLLLDVRTDQEYETKRLPGSWLIPIDELEDRVDELESETDKLTIVCCRNGNRSSDGTLILQEEGFEEVYNLGDGIDRWEGIKVFGSLEKVIRQFHALEEPAQILALAWLIEDAARGFYEFMEQVVDGENKNKFSTFKNKAADYQASIDNQANGSDYREDNSVNLEFRLAGGQQTVDQLAGWAEGRDTKEILERAVELEASTYDIYRRVEIECDEESEKRSVFAGLSAGKKHQIEELTALF